MGKNVQKFALSNKPILWGLKNEMQGQKENDLKKEMFREEMEEFLRKASLNLEPYMFIQSGFPISNPQSRLNHKARKSRS